MVFWDMIRDQAEMEVECVSVCMSVWVHVSFVNEQFGSEWHAVMQFK